MPSTLSMPPLTPAERKRMIAEADALEGELTDALNAMTPQERNAVARRTEDNLRASGHNIRVEADIAKALDMTPDEAAEMEAEIAIEREHQRMRTALATTLRDSRKRSGLTQAQVATRIKSQQGTVARAEVPQERVSLDLMLRAALASGATAQEIGQAFSG